MAKVTLTFEDVPSNGQVAVKLQSVVDRNGDAELGLSVVPSTPAMFYALAVKRIFDAGTLDTLIGFVCRDIMTNAGVTQEDQQTAMEKAGIVQS